MLGFAPGGRGDYIHNSFVCVVNEIYIYSSTGHRSKTG